jgi:hypothetical protein
MRRVSKIGNPRRYPYVLTREGRYYISEGDWIVTGVKGERWPVPSTRFSELYEPIGEGRFRSRPQVRDAIRMPNDSVRKGHLPAEPVTGSYLRHLMMPTQLKRRSLL